jgi:hypothetical protein
MYLLLLQSIPGVGDRVIPGVPLDYIATMGATQIVAAYERIRGASFSLLGLILLISFGIHAFKILASDVNPHEVWMKALVAVCLLGSYNLVFRVPFEVGYAASQVIFSDRSAYEMNKEFRDKANNELEKGREERGLVSGLVEWTTQWAAILSPTATLVELLGGIMSIIWYVTALLMGILWRLFVGILYCMGPLLIVLSILPGFGSRIQGAWICSCVQLAAWQIWSALCSLMIRTSDMMFNGWFDLNNGNLSVTNHYESIAIICAFTLLQVMGPVMIAWLLPISNASTVFGNAFNKGMGAIASGISTLSSLISAGAMLAATKGAAAAGASGGAVSGIRGLLGAAGGMGSGGGGGYSVSYDSGASELTARPMKYLGKFRPSINGQSQKQLSGGGGD